MIRNRVFRLLVASGLIAGLAIPACATDHKGPTDKWLVTFDGTKMTQTFSGNEIADAFSKDENGNDISIQPGDTMTMRVNIRNDYNGKTDWYMSNAVVKSFEDTGTADGSTKSSAYTYTLTYYPPTGSSQLLYNNHDVGGDKQDYTTTRGLGEATEGLKEFFKLDTLDKDDEAYLTLVVHLDGETEGNSYQDTLAQLKMNFAVELNEDNPTSTPSTSTTPSRPTTTTTNNTTNNRTTTTTTPTPTNNTTTTTNTATNDRNVVRTGDEFNLVPYLVAACVSGLLLLAVVFFLVKRKSAKENKGGGMK